MPGVLLAAIDPTVLQNGAQGPWEALRSPVRAIEIDTLEELPLGDFHVACRVRCMATSSDGSMIAFGHEKPPYYSVYSLAGFYPFPGEWPEHQGWDHLLGITFSPDGEYLVLAGTYLEVIRLSDRQRVVSQQCYATKYVESPSVYFNAAFASDGQYLVVGSENQGVLVYDTSTWQPLHDIGAYDTAITGSVLCFPGSHYFMTSKGAFVSLPELEIFDQRGIGYELDYFFMNRARSAIYGYDQSIWRYVDYGYSTNYWGDHWFPNWQFSVEQKPIIRFNAALYYQATVSEPQESCSVECFTWNADISPDDQYLFQAGNTDGGSVRIYDADTMARVGTLDLPPCSCVKVLDRTVRTLTGVVLDGDNNPCRRKVVLVNRTDPSGPALSTFSDEVTGTYEFKTFLTGEFNVLVLDDEKVHSVARVTIGA